MRGCRICGQRAATGSRDTPGHDALILAPMGPEPAISVYWHLYAVQAGGRFDPRDKPDDMDRP